MKVITQPAVRCVERGTCGTLPQYEHKIGAFRIIII